MERAENGALEVALMSDLSDAFISKLPQRRRSIVHTAYANAPDYIVAAINQHFDQLNYVRDTKYQQDQFGNYIDRKSTRLNSSHLEQSRMPSSA